MIGIHGITSPSEVNQKRREVFSEMENFLDFPFTHNSSWNSGELRRVDKVFVGFSDRDLELSMIEFHPPVFLGENKTVHGRRLE
jgi:hypothetical protein